MMISSKGRYALRVMIDLAQHDNGELISLKDIATRQDISIKYLEMIVRRSGIIVVIICQTIVWKNVRKNTASAPF